MKTDESKISIQRMKLESKGVWFLDGKDLVYIKRNWDYTNYDGFTNHHFIKINKGGPGTISFTLLEEINDEATWSAFAKVTSTADINDDVDKILETLKKKSLLLNPDPSREIILEFLKMNLKYFK